MRCKPAVARVVETAPAEPERRPVRPRVVARCVRLAVRIPLILGAAWLADQVPVPMLETTLSLKAPLIALVAVMLIGSTVYDTLYYDRFRP